MKKLLMVLVLAGLNAALAAQHLDGDWLANENYGAPGDSVVEEVKAQMAAYADAKADAEGIQSGEEKGDLRGAQQKCVDTALYSWVQANYLAEMGRLSAVSGNVEQAKADYQTAYKAAKAAEQADCNETAKTAKSHEQGFIIEKVIKRALKRLGVAV